MARDGTGAAGGTGGGPPGRGGAAVFLGWIVGAMVYLATLACAGALFAEAAFERWSLSLSGAVTVQLPPADGDGPEARAARLAAVRDILRATPGVAGTAVLAEDRVRSLLVPWLGEGLAADLPLPALVDVRLAPGAAVDPAALAERLAAAAPGTAVDGHGLWLSRVATLAAAAARGGWLAVGLIGLVAAVSVAFAALSGLAANRDTVELLRLMGARDGFVAGRFQRHILSGAIPACAIGGGLAVVSVLAVAGLAGAAAPGGDAPAPFLAAAAALDPLDWAVVCALPAGFAILAVAAARLAALVALRRMA